MAAAAQTLGQRGLCSSVSCCLRCSLQAIQSRDRIQLQYSQSLIEKDQYRKQVRGLEAERDKLLTTLTTLEGTKALLEAQLQRSQGGSSLKVRGQVRHFVAWGSSRCWLWICE